MANPPELVITSKEVLAKPLGAQASRLQIPEKCGHNARDPAKPEGFAKTSPYIFSDDVRRISDGVRRGKGRKAGGYRA
jgi:hypothetical protein